MYHITRAIRDICVDALIDAAAAAQPAVLTTPPHNPPPAAVRAAHRFLDAAQALTELKHGTPQALNGYDEAQAIIDASRHATRG